MPTRKDSKGRILRRGEGQRPNGQYYFKYKDAKGKTRFKYSWTLTAHDFPPKGKKADKCLREIEKQVQRDLFDRVAPEKMTVLQLVENYVSTKTAVRQTTKAGYKTVLNFLAKDEFGSRLIDAVTTLDAKSWLIYLQKASERATALSTPSGACFVLPSSLLRRTISSGETHSTSSLPLCLSMILSPEKP